MCGKGSSKKKKISSCAEPKHLLWTFIYFKVNISESLMIKLARCKSCDTFRNWVSKFTNAIASLESEVIVWENCFIDWDPRQQALITIDATDVWINELSPRSRIWWSHKFNHAGLRYKIGQCIKTGDIVWTNGPFPANISDREIFDMGLSLILLLWELVEADNGYTGRVQIETPGAAPTRLDMKQKSQVRGQHENVNRRLKVFKIMERFESTNIEKHGKIARAVAVIVQLSFENGERFYHVDYNAKYN